MNRNTKRWIPAAVVPVVIVTAAIAVPAAANADPTLPEKSPQQLLELIADSTGTAYSGTVEQSSDLGLPDVSALGSAPGGDAASSAIELITGSHTAHVFVGGPTAQRVQVLDGFAERDAIRNGDSVWLYDSKQREAVHVTASAPTGAAPTATVTPAEAAQKLLDAIEPSTGVEVVDTARVAGRAAYELRLTPGDADTLVGSVVLSVDAETGLPLAVSVTAKGESDPAFSVRFSKISFDSPDPSLFEFTPPSGTAVTEKTLPGDAPAEAATAHTEPTVVGDGWDAVIVIPANDAGGSPADDPLLDQLTTKVDGGRVLSTSLVSVLIADDGRLLIGAVGSDTLQAAAAQ